MNLLLRLRLSNVPWTRLISRSLGPLLLCVGVYATVHADEHEGSAPPPQIEPQAQVEPQSVAPTESLTASPTTSQDVLPDFPPLETFDEIIARPLFSSTRRPKAVDEPEEENSDASEIKQTWMLVGVILNTEAPIAFFAKTDGSKKISLSKGMTLDASWTLEEVGPDHAVVIAGEDQARFELWRPRSRVASGRTDSAAQTDPQRSATDTRLEQRTPVINGDTNRIRNPGVSNQRRQ